MKISRLPFILPFIATNFLFIPIQIWNERSSTSSLPIGMPYLSAEPVNLPHYRFQPIPL